MRCPQTQYRPLGSGSDGAVAVAAFIAAQRAEHRVPHAVSCRALGVSQSWFYKWAHGDASPRRARRAALAAEVARLFAAHQGKRGSPGITADLRDAGWAVSVSTVAALMRERGLAARPKRKRKGATRQGRGRWRAPDLAGRDFTAERVNQKWFGDGTEIGTDEGKLHLASVLDIRSRKILGFSLSEHHDADLAYGGLVMAAAARGGDVAGVIFHTGQGSEGEVNRSSQHLDLEVFGWDGQRRGSRRRRGGRRCVRQGGLRWPGENTGSGSGWRSPGECRVRTPALRLVCLRQLVRGGSVTVAGSGRSAWRRCRGGTCRLRSGRRSRSCGSGGAVSVRSRGVPAGRRRRSRGSCAGMLQPGAAGWSTGPWPPSGTQICGHAVPGPRNWLRTRPCGSTCKTGSPARSPGRVAGRCRARRCAGSGAGTAGGRTGVVEPGADLQPAAGRFP